MMGIPGIKGRASFGLFVLFFALCISGVAAWYSIVGLMAIFSGAALAIAVMGGVLEVGKLVAASWLYNNWKSAPVLMKSYLTLAVVVLMFITSMGIFGFLSKAHLEQVGPTGNHQAKVEKYEFDIGQQEKRIDRAGHVLSQFDSALKEYFDRGYITRGLKERKKQTEEREQLQKEIAAANKQIDLLSEKKFKEQKELRGIEAEVGPIKYIAELVYGEGDQADKHLDQAVRWMIILFIFVFDPLAVLLVIAGNISLKQRDKQPEQPEPTPLPLPLPSQPPPPPPVVPVEPEPPAPPLPPPEPTPPVQIENFEEIVEQVFGNANMPFNLDGADGQRLKQQLIRSLRRKK